MVKNTCLAKRAGEHEEEIEITELVPGDIVYLAAGDMVPADIRIIDSKDLFISQASLTGESEPIEKFPEGTGDNSFGKEVLSNWTIFAIWVPM